MKIITDLEAMASTEIKPLRSFRSVEEVIEELDRVRFEIADLQLKVSGLTARMKEIEPQRNEDVKKRASYENPEDAPKMSRAELEWTELSITIPTILRRIKELDLYRKKLLLSRQMLVQNGANDAHAPASVSVLS